MSARTLARRLGLGKAMLYGVHRPVGLTRHMILEGGPVEQRRTAAGKREMMAAAQRLPPLAAPPGPPLGPVAFLSGAAFWYQTLFCFASLQRHVEQRIDPVIHDDGTLTGAHRETIARAIPWVRFVDTGAAQETLERVLPRERFPALRARRDAYPHLRKLTDLHAAAHGWSLVMDSDMLFFRRPDALVDFLRRPVRPIHLAERPSAYGYSGALMAELARGPVPEGVNVGLYAVHGPSIDWDHLEACCRAQLSREGPHYYQEQALTALLLAGTGGQALPADEYRVLPPLAEGRAPTAVMHHYVAQSKRSYFQYGWRHVLAGLACGACAA